MKQKYRLWQRRGKVFYAFDCETKQQISLGTCDKNEALRLLSARNEANQTPGLGLQIARAYLATADPAICKRTWRAVAEALIKTKRDENADRWRRAIKDKAFKAILDKPLIKTNADHFLAVLDAGTVSTNVFLRRLHNFAVGFGWLLAPVLPDGLQWHEEVP